MIIVLQSELERGHLERAVAAYVNVRGRDAVPDGLVVLLDALSRHNSPQLATVVDVVDVDVHGGLMTYQQVADRFGVSKTTVSRHVKAGRLTPVGRRIRTVDVVAFEMSS